MYYRSLNAYLRETFGCKVYKLALSAGCTCPNRDGTLDARGCIFCSGSGEFAASAALPVSEQLAQAKRLVAAKAGPDARYIAYFQDYSNTYAPADQLRRCFWPQSTGMRSARCLSRPDRTACRRRSSRCSRSCGKGSLSGSSLAYRRSTHPLRGISGAAIPFPCLTMPSGSSRRWISMWSRI